MDSDEEDFVFVGTPIEREEEVGSRRKKAAAEASGQLRSLPSWKQEVIDEEGRRRFHGAFTGGFSAGYFNTVGSKEGWTPQTFTSSRKNRVAIKQQNIMNFLDEDEKAELEGQSVRTSSQFDTFGSTAAEYARKEAEKEQKNRPSAIPGPVPDELVLPVTESIGVKLLIKMGWRRGRAIKDSHPSSVSDARREARKALLAFGSDDASARKVIDSEPVGDIESLVAQSVDDDHHGSQDANISVPDPKQDLHGLGYDPFKHAPEFREKKRTRLSGNQERGTRKADRRKDNLFGLKSGKAAPGFGIGALEEFDAEDEDVYSSGYDFEETFIEEDEEPTKLETVSKPRLGWKEQGVLPGFKVASESDFQVERFDPPVIPKEFVPQHKFPGPLERERSDIPPPPEVPPPDDNNLRLLTESVARLVSRCGKLFEDLSREKNQSNPLFGFLSGGVGHDYYERKLWEGRKKLSGSSRHSLDGKSSPSVQKMTAESRGRLLGEKPLERILDDGASSATQRDFSHLQVNLTDTFTKPASSNELVEISKPFKDDPTKQARFEHFLKEKYQGGLRSTSSNASNNMSEAARARERLDFEAAAEALEKGKLRDESKSSMQHALDFLPSSGMAFISGGQQVKDAQSENLSVKKMFPRREEIQWRPSPILCKRFDLVDPYMGKPPPAPRTKSKMDSLLFMTDSNSATKLEDDVRTNKELPVAHSDKTVGSFEEETEVESIERPVDLYKAIFSDDSEDEVEDSNANKADESEKKTEIATTLNRLIAGDFLESLGKELGLEVPLEAPYQKNNSKGLEKDRHDAATGDVKIVSVHNKSPSILVGEASNSMQASPQRETAEVVRSPKGRDIQSSGFDRNSHHATEDNLLLQRSDNPYKIAREARKVKSPSRRHVNKDFGTFSSDDESDRNRARRQRYNKSSDSYSDSSSDDRDRYTSESKRRKKRSSHGKSSSRKHSKHHNRHRSKESPKRSSHYDYEKRRTESRKHKRKRD